MRVLVTGGAGYLGSSLVKLLLQQGHMVRLFDRFAYGEEAVADFADSANCEIVHGDIRRLQESPGLLDGIDAIAHLASLSNDPSCDLDAEMATDINLESTRELANQAVQQGVRRFVLASTCSVYGKGVFPLLDEDSPTNPVSTFAQSKLEAERAVLNMQSEVFEPVVARAATLFGWSPRMRFDLAVNQMVATAKKSETISVMGGGNQWRPFVHVQDAARALVLLLEAPAKKAAGEVFNVGSDICNFRIIELAERISKAFDGIDIETPKGDEDLRTYRVQFAKIRQLLGFKCEWTIDEGISEISETLDSSGVDPFGEVFFNVRRMKQLLALPVDEGGEPVATHFIPLVKPSLGPEEEEAVVETLRSGWLTSGPSVQAFESAFSETVSSQHTVAVSSCTAGLHLCLAHLGVGPGDEVITSPITWASTGNTVINMGAKVVFADIDPETLNIDPAAIEEAITERTKVIMPVHLAGQPCDLDAIHVIAKKHSVHVIEDAAHALGASLNGTPIGSYGEFACFSFYAIKNITTMEGGTVTLKDENVAATIRRLAANGMTATAWQRYGRSAAPSPPQVVDPGFKYLMGNVNAAMGLAQLKKFPKFKAARQRLAKMYQSVLADVDEISLPKVAEGVDHAWHLMMIRLDLSKLNKSRDDIAFAMRRENIGTGVHFLGLHLHPYYQEALGFTPEQFPEATAASHEILSLPLFPSMTDMNVKSVVEALKKVLAHSRGK